MELEPDIATAPPRPARRLATPRLDRQELAAIFAGGFIGALARASLTQALPVAASAWPWPTFAINIAGAAMLGYFITRLQERLPPSRYGRAFLGTGVCGALTTFSTVMVQLVAMFEHDRPGLALGYAGASLLAGLATVFLTTKLVRRARLA